MRRAVHLLGAPMGLGGRHGGAELGPQAVRIAGIHAAIGALGLGFRDRGDVAAPRPEGGAGHPLSWPRPAGAGPAFLGEIATCCRALRRGVETILDEDGFPLVVGGDHSIACGSLAGLSSWYRRRGERVGLIWFDAHCDMNTPASSPSGNVHGMPLACCVGLGPPELVELGDAVPMVDPARAVLIGIREVDESERAQIERSGVRLYTMHEIDVLGMDRVAREAIEIASAGAVGFHLSFDLDGCDPIEAPGVGTPVRGGVTHREAHLLMEHAAHSGALLGLEMTEINPCLDFRNRTAEFAVDLILSALGKRIY